MIVVVAVEADDGPVFPAPSVAPPEANLGCTVPSPQLDTVIVYVVPLPDTPNEHPVAAPAFEKSPDATPVTVSENSSV